MLERETAEATKAAQARLLQRVAGGDLGAVSELYDQIAAPLFSVAVRILGDTADAEEVVQDVFVQIWEKAGTFDVGLGSAFHWALSITRHRCIDRLRSRARRTRLVEEFQTNMVTSVSTTLESTSSLDSDDTRALRNAMNNLPEDQQQAIELAFFGGKTHLEIAEFLNQPLGTVKARIRRGMLKLRESLQEYA
ncbi:MAG TPA: sigma-70 family RNA polymerase sigma factor [Candidatus Limnocylindrales bacterium]|nr:sigma-70 family RNA polymerase sigma factor [Candidatus Limnocylindrales bacterium]